MAFGKNEDGSDSSSGGDKPVLKNSENGVAAWLNQDKNGNAYLSVSLPLGMGKVNLFPPNDELTEAFNQLYKHLNGGGQ